MSEGLNLKTTLNQTYLRLNLILVIFDFEIFGIFLTVLIWLDEVFAETILNDNELFDLLMKAFTSDVGRTSISNSHFQLQTFLVYSAAD